MNVLYNGAMILKKIVVPGIALIAVCYAFARYSFGLFLPTIGKSLGLTLSTWD